MKIAVFGYSGSGKSTLSAYLGNIYNLPVLHLDRVHWLPGWKERELSEEISIVRDFIDSNNRWIIDGNYAKLLFEERMELADSIIFMDFSALSCLRRAFARYLRYKGKTRDSITVGCDEKFDLEFVLWLLFYGRTKRRKQRYRQVVSKYPEKIEIISNQKQLDKFMKSIAEHN